MSPTIPASCSRPILIFSDVTVYAFGTAQERDDAAEAMESYNVVHDTPLLYWETGSDELLDRDEWVYLLCDVSVGGLVSQSVCVVVYSAVHFAYQRYRCRSAPTQNVCVYCAVPQGLPR